MEIAEMGLDLFTTDEEPLHIKVGSYSSVHVLRTQLLIGYAALRWGESQYRQDVLDALAAAPVAVYPEWTPEIELRKSLQAKVLEDHDLPHYERLGDLRLRARDTVLRGLLAFIEHSDCDGGHSIEETHEISQALAAVVPCFKGESMHRGRADWIEYIARFFQEAAARSVAVEYC
jgi:hypothetical protein